MKKISIKISILLLAIILPSVAGAATLSVSPSSQSIKAGETFSVTVRLDTQGESIDGVDIRYLNYNPALLKVVDADSSKDGIQISAGKLMSATLLNRVDESQGRISFSQVALGGTKYKGTGTLATINFKALAGGNAHLTFNYTPKNTTDSNVAASGQDILNAVINGSYAVGGASPAPGSASDQQNDPSYQNNVENLPSGSFVPLPPGSEGEELVTPGSSVSGSSFGDFLRYIVSRIKNGFLRIFGR